ncbi:MAG: NUDIX domain-containing protein [Chloroflexi bacterium]|nr:NUDIX domain-containing protein [Chloroflexota bacterium]
MGPGRFTLAGRRHADAARIEPGMTVTPPAHRYCAACGSDQIAPRLIHHTHCSACGVTDWKNPHPVAGAFILRDDRLLLVRRAAHMERGAGGWVFPGGFVERGETPWQGAVRETQEEALVSPRILRAMPPRTVLDPHHVVMPFLATLDPSEEPRPGPECSEVRWFPLDEIPWDEVPFSTTAAALRGLVEATPPTEHGIETYREVPRPGRSRAPFRFCIRCRALLDLPGEDGAVRCPSCGWGRWDNPSPTAGFVPIQDRRVLLGLRRQDQDGAGYWAFPSGHMEPGETPEDTAQRELLEESGVTARAERFVGLFASGDYHEALYTGPVLDASGTPSGEFERLEWFTGPEAAALPGHDGTPDLVAWARREDLLD